VRRPAKFATPLPATFGISGVALLALALLLGVVAPAGASAPDPAAAAASVPPPSPDFIPVPSRDYGAALAHVVVNADATQYPGTGNPIYTVRTATSFSHEPTTLLALASARVNGVDYVRVLLPIRPNGTVAWIPMDNVDISYTHYWITIKRSNHLVTLYRRGDRTHTFRAVVGKTATPTPLGLAAIYEKNRQPDPNAFLGPWALPLTILSNTLQSYGGGPGRVAIHGRSGASLADPIGSSRSHGCIRVNNDRIEMLAHKLPQGTPVKIIP